MCIAVPGEIRDISGDLARVDMMGIETKVNIQLIEDPCIGDRVLIHAGCAIEKIDREYFDDLLHIFKSILDGDGDWDG